MMRVYKSGENLSLGFRTRSDTNRAVQPQKMVMYKGPTQTGLYKRFVSDLVGNTEDSFFHDTAHIQPAMYTFCICAAQLLYVVCHYVLYAICIWSEFEFNKVLFCSVGVSRHSKQECQVEIVGYLTTWFLGKPPGGTLPLFSAILLPVIDNLFSSTQWKREKSLHNRLFFFCFGFSLTSLLRLFHSYPDKPFGRWGETGVPRENHLKHPQAELGLSHMWQVQGSNLHQTQR